MRPSPTSRLAQLRVRAAFTLLEIVVTLVILGLAAAIMAPVFGRNEQTGETVGSLLADARELAVRRAQSVRLDVNERGNWQLIAGDTTILRSGAIRAGPRALRVRVNALGACFNEGPTPLPGLDTVDCKLR